MSSFSRRGLLQGAAALAGASLLPSKAFAQAAAPKSTLLCIFLDGGYNALFGSADSFLAGGTFGTSAGTVKTLGGGLAVDAPTFGTMPQVALDRMASVGVRHGLTAHEAAQPSLWTMSNRSYPTMLAKALGGDAAIKAAVVGNQMPAGARPAEGGVSLQTISDMRATIVALGGAVGDPTVPDRAIATDVMAGSDMMSARRLKRSPRSLRSVADGFSTGIDALKKNGLVLDYNALASAYSIPTTTTAVNNFRTQMVAAELMVLAGSNVVVAIDQGWDTHGDTNGNTVRTMMNQRILPPLNTFLARTQAMTDRDVTVVIFGDFSRSLPGSDHQGNMTATVIGKKVKQGSTGKVGGNVSLPAGTPGIQEFWAYLAAVTGCPGQPFGNNPHTAITLT
ncbi:MAG: DUF1501 domain-containing protein [Myxococcaceae bacterium]|nr:DUF1501 domain-containing protein [Myxococcaceae bacterium]